MYHNNTLNQFHAITQEQLYLLTNNNSRDFALLLDSLAKKHIYAQEINFLFFSTLFS